MENHLLLIIMVISGLSSARGEEHTWKRQSEVVDLTSNLTRHNAVEHKILVGSSNTTGSLVERSSRYYPETPPLPISIEVREGSGLVAEPGRLSTVVFDVTSNLPGARQFFFTVQDTANFRTTDYPVPQRAVISTGNTVQARVTMQPPLGKSGGNPNIITFTAWWNDGFQQTVRKRAYFYVGSEGYDSYSPDIWYEYEGDCSGSVSPRNCEAKNWKAIVSIQDSDSGLLRLRSDPIGLILDKEFIVGTKDVVRGYYASSCCQTKVDITATDILGNTRVKFIDIERRWLSAGDIAAIVLSCILLVIIIAFIVYMIVLCCRRRKATLSIYPKHSRREEP